MKTKLLMALLIGIPLYMNAADRIVQQNGPAGTYSSIGLAVAAAVDGDRIVINNKPGGVPWIEDVTINKSIVFVSALDTIKFLVQGNYTVMPAANRDISIIGMKNLIGGFSPSASGDTNNRTKVTIVDSELSDGQVSIAYDGFEVNVLSSKINGKVRIMYGNIIGNEVMKIEYDSELTKTNSNINRIIGNVIITSIYSNNPGIDINCMSSYFGVYNNFIDINNSNNKGIIITNMKNGAIDNVLSNNSVLAYQNDGIYITTSDYRLIVENNIIDNSSTFGGTGLTNNNNLAYFSYNFISTDFNNLFTGIGDNSTNNKVNALSAINSPALISDPFYDGGNPSNEYLDVDLSRNDSGCYGGSYSLSNFHPINNNKSSRVSFFKVPRVVNQGNTFNVEGIGFDK